MHNLRVSPAQQKKLDYLDMQLLMNLPEVVDDILSMDIQCNLMDIDRQYSGMNDGIKA